MTHVSGWLLLGCGMAFFASACTERGELTTETKIVSAEGARSVDVRLKMGAGKLRLSGGASELLEARFVHRGNDRTPEVSYHVSEAKGYLTVKQRRGVIFGFGRSHNDWDLRLAGAMPADLNVSLGAGENELDLREIDVRSLRVDMGVGEMRLDLRGRRPQNLDVEIDGGVGNALIRLPNDIGVRAEIDGGIGSVHAPGFSKNARFYTNEAFGKSPSAIDLKVSAGIGSISLELD
jgi:hypothetical protein